MAVKIRIPSSLRQIVKNKMHLEAEGNTVTELIQNLNSKFPGIWDRIFDSDGNKRKFINVYVNEQDIRFLQNKDTLLENGDEVDVVVAIAGG